jgi:hypothetical protein
MLDLGVSVASEVESDVFWNHVLDRYGSFVFFSFNIDVSSGSLFLPVIGNIEELPFLGVKGWEWEGNFFVLGIFLDTEGISR